VVQLLKLSAAEVRISEISTANPSALELVAGIFDVLSDTACTVAEKLQ